MEESDQFARRIGGDNFGLEGVMFFRRGLAPYGNAKKQETEKRKDFRHNWASIVKTIAQLNVDLARVEVMSAAEGETIVEEEAPIGHVQTGNRNRQTIGDGFS